VIIERQTESGSKMFPPSLINRQVNVTRRESYNEPRFPRGSVMKGSNVEAAAQAGRCLNAVALKNAVLCAECDVVSDSPHDRCLVCGSRSLFNIARLFGGNLPKDRASLIASDSRELTPYEVVLSFPEPRRLHAKAAG
jgi:hypothetical protein